MKDGKIWIGGDSAASQGDDIEIAATPKVFKRGQFVYGYAGCYRTGQVMHHLFREPDRKRGQSDIAYLVGPFIDAMRATIKKAGTDKTLNAGSEATYAQMLLGYRGHLYCVENDFAVLECVDGIEAVGTGRPYAIGAMHATPTLSPSVRVRRGLNTAARWCSSVRGPFRIVSI